MAEQARSEDATLIKFPVSEGMTLVADAWGDPSADPILFMHGGGQTRHSWGGAARALARRGWHTITVDLRGHGDSSWSPTGSYDTNHYVDDLYRMVDQLGRLPVLVGASLGGSTAMAGVGEAEHEVCRGMVLVDIAPKAEKEGVERIRAFMRANLEGFATVEEAADAVAAYRRHRTRPKDVSGLHKNLRLKEDGRYYWHWDPRFMEGARRGNAEYEARIRKAVQQIRVPTLLVRGGASDVVSEEGARDFLALVPHGEYVDVSGAGHMVAGDKNDHFTDAVQDFLSRTFNR